MADTLQSIKLIDLIPSNLRTDPKVQAAADALDAELKLVTESVKEVLYLSRMDELSEDVLDLLAWQFHVDFYETNLTLEQKRKLVITAIDAHRRKGTPHVVELVVKAILEDAFVQEWFEYGGEPYHFRVVRIGGQAIDADTYARLEKAIATVKNTRSWLEGVSFFRAIGHSVYFGIVQATHKKIDIYPSAFRIPDISSTQYYSGLSHIHKKVSI